MPLARIVTVTLAFTLAAFARAPGDDRKAPSLDLPTNDPLLKEQWHLFDPKGPHGEPGSINAVGAWKLVRPASRSWSP